jgi:hypothetical protein
MPLEVIVTDNPSTQHVNPKLHLLFDTCRLITERFAGRGRDALTLFTIDLAVRGKIRCQKIS